MHKDSGLSVKLHHFNTLKIKVCGNVDAKGRFSYCEFSYTQLMRIGSIVVITHIIPTPQLLRISKIKGTLTITNFFPSLVGATNIY